MTQTIERKTRTERKALTDAAIRNLKLRPKPFVIADTLSPLRVMVRPSGASYFVWHRFGGAKNPATRTIGKVTAVKLADARETARAWVQLGKGKDDPVRIESERLKREAAERAVTFGVVWGDYCRLRLAQQRRGFRVRGEIEAEVMNKRRADWRERPLRSISKADVVKVVDGVVARGCAPQAHNVLSGLKTFFNWAISRSIYGLETAPTDRLSAKMLVGPTPARQRTLTDEELFAFWRAADREGYPFGSCFRLLALTGQRLNEIGGMQWRELHPELLRLIRHQGEGGIDWRAVPAEVKLLTVPAERFKSGVTHTVPLSDDACALLAALPRFKGPYVFTATGDTPIRGFGRAKDRLDARMLLTLRALARRRGDEDWRTVKLEPFVNHDLRRTVRTRLSALRVPDRVAEMVLGHAGRGLQRVYDQHSYAPEMREALEAWAKKLNSIAVKPTAGNVIALPMAAPSQSGR